MLKKIVPLVLFLALLSAIGGYLYVNKTESYKYSDSQTRKQEIERVEFLNGASIAVKKDEFGGSVIVANSFDGKRSQTISDEFNDRCYVNDYFISQRTAGMALISETCSGTICLLTGNNYKLVVPDENFVKVYEIGADLKDFTATFNRKGELLSAVALTEGRDELGSPASIRVEFIPGVGFVSKRMQSKFYKLVDKSPEAFFNDVETRDLLLKTMSKDDFLAMRADMNRSSNSKLISGRFLLFQGCNNQFCGGGHAAILIDTYTDNLWWTKISSSENDSGGTVALTKDTDPPVTMLSAVLSSESDYHDHKLTFSKDGELIYKHN